jgi:hypothetical protein
MSTSRYTGVVRSIADALRERTHTAVARLAPMARVRLALELGDADANLVATSRGVSVDEARRLLARARNLGRVPSVANVRSVR